MTGGERVGHRTADQRLPTERRILERKRAIVVECATKSCPGRLLDALVGIGVSEIGEAITETGRTLANRLELFERLEQFPETRRDHCAGRAIAAASCLPLGVRGSADSDSILLGCMYRGSSRAANSSSRLRLPSWTRTT